MMPKPELLVDLTKNLYHWKTPEKRSMRMTGHRLYNKTSIKRYETFQLIQFALSLHYPVKEPNSEFIEEKKTSNRENR